MQGFLYWGLNIWTRENNDAPIPDDSDPRLKWSVATGKEGQVWDILNGDGTLLYPGQKGPLGCMRLENIRDGLQDIELLKQYGEKFGDVAENRLIARVSTDILHFSRDKGQLMFARHEVLTALGQVDKRSKQ